MKVSLYVSLIFLVQLKIKCQSIIFGSVAKIIIIMEITQGYWIILILHKLRFYHIFQNWFKFMKTFYEWKLQENCKIYPASVYLPPNFLLIFLYVLDYMHEGKQMPGVAYLKKRKWVIIFAKCLNFIPNSMNIMKKKPWKHKAKKYKLLLSSLFWLEGVWKSISLVCQGDKNHRRNGNWII